MNQSRQVRSVPVLQFGRRAPFAVAMPAPAAALSDEVKLFATTFGAGLLFMTVYLA